MLISKKFLGVMVSVLVLGIFLFPHSVSAKTYEFSNATVVEVDFNDPNHEVAELIVDAGTHGAAEVLKHFGYLATAKLTAGIGAFISMIDVANPPTTTKTLVGWKGDKPKGEINIDKYEYFLPFILYKFGTTQMISTGVSIEIEREEGSWPSNSWEPVKTISLLRRNEVNRLRHGAYHDYVIIPKGSRTKLFELGDTGTYRVRAKFGGGSADEWDAGIVNVE